MKLIRSSLIFSLVTVLGIFSISSVSNAEAAYDIPDWVKNVAGMWFSGAIDDDAFGASLDWLIENKIITTPSSSPSDNFPIGGNGTHTVFPIGGNGTHTVFPIGGNGTHTVSPSDNFPIGGNGTHTVFPIGGNGTHMIIPIN